MSNQQLIIAHELSWLVCSEQIERSFVDCVPLDQPVGVLFVVDFLVPEAVFFPLVLFFARVATVAFLVRPRVVRVVVSFAVVDDRPFAEGVWESDEGSSVVVTFLRVRRRVAAPFCVGLSPAFRCSATYS